MIFCQNCMRPYEVEIHGVKVKASVLTDSDRLIDDKICEFKKLNQKYVVGVDIKAKYNSASLFLLCVEGHCLIIPKLSLARIKDASKSELLQLLSDQTTCFVGSNNIGIMKYFTTGGYENSSRVIFEMIGGTGVELGRLAAMILKKPSLEKKGVYELAGEIGLDLKPVTGTCPNWDAKVFSEEEIIKYAVHDIYAFYHVGEKLLGMI